MLFIHTIMRVELTYSLTIMRETIARLDVMVAKFAPLKIRQRILAAETYDTHDTYKPRATRNGTRVDINF